MTFFSGGGSGGSGGGTWGSITGTLSAQTDLQNALDAKADTGDVFSGDYNDLSNQPTIPTNNNQLTNGAGYITSYTVTESDVTSHEGALTITESQISDLGSYLEQGSNVSPYAMVVDEATTNLVENPKFENNITDFWNNTGTTTNSHNTTENELGSGCLQITTSSNLGGVVSDPVPVDASSMYVLSVWIKGASGGEIPLLSIDPDNGSTVNSYTTALGAYAVNDSLTTDYLKLQLPITTNASATQVELYIRSSTASSQTMYVDRVQFEKKTIPSGAVDYPFGSSYCDGDAGDGYAWTGTANNSTSTRTAGVHFPAPMEGDGASGLIVGTDGNIKRATFNAGEITQGDLGAEPQFPYKFISDQKTNVGTSGVSVGTVLMENTADGSALHVKSSASSAYGFVLDTGNITSGACMAIFAPSDLQTLLDNDGRFFLFSGKGQGLSMYQWAVDASISGSETFMFNNMSRMYSGGGMDDSTERTGLSGTVGWTKNTKNVTGSGTAFLTDYKRGDSIRINTAGSTYTQHTVASVNSDTSITTVANVTQNSASGKAHKSYARQYSPANIQMEGTYSNHAGVVTDYFYNLFPSGGNGQLRVMKSSSLGDASMPTADNDGDGLVTARHVETSTNSISASGTETTVVDGYTVPAHELKSGSALRVKFSGDMTTLASSTTCTWRVKLGGTTLLTSNVQQSGSTNAIDFSGEVMIVGTSDTAQRVSLNISGKDTSTSATPTYLVCEYGTGSRDMRIDRDLTITADFSDGSSMNVYFNTVEIL